MGTVAAAKRELSERADKAFRALILESTKRVVMRTPVKTGALMGNWNIAAGEPDRSADEAKTDKSGTTVILAAAGLQAPVGDKVYLTNSLPYALPIEAGHGGRPPGVMVGMVAAEMAVIARQVAREVKNGL